MNFENHGIDTSQDIAKDFRVELRGDYSGKGNITTYYTLNGKELSTRNNVSGFDVPSKDRLQSMNKLQIKTLLTKEFKPKIKQITDAHLASVRADMRSANIAYDDNALQVAVTKMKILGV